MSKPRDVSAAKESELSRFQRLARAIFGVDKRDVAKHEPTKRVKKDDPPSV